MYLLKHGQMSRCQTAIDEVIEYRKILVPLDGTDLSERAIPYAMAIAKRKNSEVHLLYICDTKSITRRGPWKYLWEKVGELHSAGIKLSPTVATGKVTEQTVEFADNHSIDLIIVSIHGGAGIGQWIRGDVSRRLAHEMRIPLLLIWTSFEPISVEGNRKWRILVPLDGSAFAETCLPYAAPLVNESHGEIILIRVNDEPEPPLHVTMDPFPEWDTYRAASVSRKRETMCRYLVQISQQLRSKGINVRYELTAGEAADEIVRYAEYSGVDLIAISTHEHHGFMRVFRGSVAKKVIESTTKPVLLVRPY
jgi:nucleotide-binding universal stress UspA family protein